MATKATRRKQSKKKQTECRPGGPFCIGMNALLDAQSPRGIQTGILIKDSKTRSVIVHPARSDDKKLKMVLSFCPCCKGDLVPPRAEAEPSGRPPSARRSKATTADAGRAA